MKKIDLGQAIQIVANIGVIAVIVFLALQVRQSNIQAGTASLFEHSGQQSEWMYLVGGDPQAATIDFEGLQNFSQLAPVDQLRFDLLIRSQLIRLEAGYEADRVLGQNRGATMRMRTVEGLFAQDGFREWWNFIDRDTLPLPLREYLTELDPNGR